MPYPVFLKIIDMLSSSEFLNHNLQSENELKNIVSSENLFYYKGFGLSPNVRLFVFKDQPEAFFINLIPQTLQDNCLAIVPPEQLHFLSPIECGDFICIELPSIALVDEDFSFMTRLIYSKQKHLHLGKMEGFDYDQFKIIMSNENNHQLSLQLLKNKIEKAYPNRLGNAEKPCGSYIKLAFLFESLIKDIKSFNLDSTNISSYTERLNCSEKTLYRACDEVFRVSPQEILKHHLLQSSIYLLFQENYQLNNIAEILGYSTVQGFLRFIKSTTNLTPNKIRKKFQEDAFKTQFTQGKLPELDSKNV